VRGAHGGGARFGSSYGPSFDRRLALHVGRIPLGGRWHAPAAVGFKHEVRPMRPVVEQGPGVVRLGLDELPRFDNVMSVLVAVVVVDLADRRRGDARRGDGRNQFARGFTRRDGILPAY
jgi:hypothetical protein